MSSTLFRVGRNVFSNWIAYVVNIVVSFFLAPFMVHSLGDTAYGIWVLVGSLTGYLGVLDLGLRPAVVRYVAGYKAVGDNLMVNRVVNTILVILSVVAAIVILVSLIVCFFSLDLFKVPSEFHEEFRLIILIIGLNVAVSFPFSVLGSLLAAAERYDLGNAVQVSVFLLRAIFLVIVLKLGGGLVAVGLVVLVASIVDFAFKTKISFRLFPALQLGWKMASRETFKLIRNFSGYAFVINIASRVTLQSNALVIGSMLSAEAITFFSIGSTMVDYLLSLVAYMSNTVLPLASVYDKQKNFEKLRQLLILGTSYCVIVILPISYVFIVLGEAFINLWMGTSYGPTSSAVLTILTIGYFGFLSQSVANVIFVGLGKLRNLAILNVTLAAANILLGIILIKHYDVYGSALGTAITLIISHSIIYPIYICRTVQLNLFKYLLKSYLWPIMVSLPFLAIVLAGRFLVTVDSYTTFVLLVGVACLVHAVASFFLVLDPDHRRSVLAKLRSLRARE
jgi:O-antigen/teichoic acid export membrane protein